MGGLSLQAAATIADGELIGDVEAFVEDVTSFEEAGPEHATFLEKESLAGQLASSRAGVVFVTPAVRAAAPSGHPPLIVADDPMGAFIELMLRLRPAEARPPIGISEHATISPSARIGCDCNIFPGVFIGPDVVLGDRCTIYPGAFLQSRCRLGDDVTIHANSVLYSDVSLGDRVVVHASCVLGADGFGYRLREGRYLRIPHTGGVRIEADVEIGAGTTIDRAMIGSTVIGEGTKIDNQVMIAHNCRVGRHNAFASQVGLAGSVTTGDYVRCGGQVGVADHCHLGTGCSLGAGAGVPSDIPAGKDYHGYPARPVKDAYRIAMSMQKLPEMRKQFRELQSQMHQLQSQLASLSGDDTRHESAA